MDQVASSPLMWSYLAQAPPAPQFRWHLELSSLFGISHQHLLISPVFPLGTHVIGIFFAVSLCRQCRTFHTLGTKFPFLNGLLKETKANHFSAGTNWGAVGPGTQN